MIPIRPAIRRAIRRALAAAALALLAGAATAGAQSTSSSTPPAIQREFRGAWVASVSNIDWPSRKGLSAFEQQAELVAIMNRAVALNLNAIVLQVRPAADALYESPHEPWSEYLTGLQGRAPEPNYDPLAFAVAEAHRRGLELHAWFNPYRARHASAKAPDARTHVDEAHPALAKTYGNMRWMDPGEPAVVAQTLRVMLDVVKRYDVDGIHIDDYFYPYPINGADGQPMQFPDSASYARYVRRGGKLARDDWRRHNVDTLIYQIYRGTKKLKPWVKVGISPFGIWRPGYPATITGFDAYSKLYADSRKWLREGWVDYWTPQLYWPIAQTAQSYPVLLDWWMGQNVKGRAIWPGHNTSTAAGTRWPADELPEQIRATRAAGGTGAVHFSMKALMPAGWTAPAAPVATAATTTVARRDSAPRRDTTRRDAARADTGVAPVSLAERLRTGVYAEPAVPPAMPWLSKVTPQAPVARLAADRATGEQVLHLTPTGTRRVAWWTVRVRQDGAWTSRVLPGAQRHAVVSGAARPDQVLVTAVDRYGNESAVVDATRPAPRPAARPAARAKRG